ncbi:MAG: hypothetical protein JST85_16665 [Acidobacteria bacterium]|nr:hypothetical protein [Acidobacteriota bacterium]
MSTKKVCLLIGLLSVLISGDWIFGSGISQAQNVQNTLDVRTSVEDGSYKVLIEKPVMVSVIKDGQVLKQAEVRLNSNAAFAIPAGLYDIRCEGDGMVTLVKRGIHVNAGEMTKIIGGPMKAGAGAHVVEYAPTGMSREEMAARIGKLESEMAELKKARQGK